MVGIGRLRSELPLRLWCGVAWLLLLGLRIIEPRGSGRRRHAAKTEIPGERVSFNQTPIQQCTDQTVELGAAADWNVWSPPSNGDQTELLA